MNGKIAESTGTWIYAGGKAKCGNLSKLPDDMLLALLQASQLMLRSLVESLELRQHMQNATRQLMRPDDTSETFSELAVKEPDLMWLILQASVAALVNVQSVEATDAETGGDRKLISNLSPGFLKKNLSFGSTDSFSHVPSLQFSHELPTLFPVL